MKPLSNWDIDKIFMRNPRYGGCFSRNTLPIVPRGLFYVMNMDVDSGSGTHWVGIYCCHPDHDYYFDSFGCPPPEEVLAFLKSNEKPLIINDVRIQSLTSANCGYFACEVMIQLDKGYKFSTIILDHFTKKIGHSEQYIDKLFAHFKHVLYDPSNPYD
jgi:hypothetical protein